jgi:hypothetical protein
MEIITNLISVSLVESVVLRKRNEEEKPDLLIDNEYVLACSWLSNHINDFFSIHQYKNRHQVVVLMA